MADGNITVEVSTHAAQAEIERLRRDAALLAREAHTWWKACADATEKLERAVKPRAPLTRQQIDDVMTQHYPLSSLLREEVDAFEACVRDIERLHGIGA
jgi:hypothetical protein